MAEVWAAGLPWEGPGPAVASSGGLWGWGESWGGSCAGSEGLGPAACEDAVGFHLLPRPEPHFLGGVRGWILPEASADLWLPKQSGTSAQAHWPRQPCVPRSHAL